MIIMGHVVNAFGIQGWIRVLPYTETIDSLFDYNAWWLSQDNENWTEISVITGRVNGDFLDVKLASCDDRDQALQFKGQKIAIQRNQLPALSDSGKEGYYWTDLIGVHVFNLNEEQLGKVVGLLETGANDVLRVQPVLVNSQELLIPFVERTIIKKVDLANARITVDWESNY